MLSIKKTNNNMFPVELSNVGRVNVAVEKHNQTMRWHQRLGHLNLQSLKMLKAKDMVTGMPNIGDMDSCDECVFGKHARCPFAHESGKSRRATEKLQRVHMDICGPMHVRSMGGNKFFLLLVDDYTRMTWVYFLQSKSEAFECFLKFQAAVERETVLKVKVLRSDRGGEFLSREFNDHCERSGIQRELTPSYTPQLNGTVERKNRVIVEKTGVC